MKLIVVALFALLCPATAAFVVIPRANDNGGLRTAIEAAVVNQPHQDRWVPDSVRATRSKDIRDKLLGDQEPFQYQGACPLLAAQKAKDEAKKKKASSKYDSHRLLDQMTKVLEQHIYHTAAIDSNC